MHYLGSSGLVYLHVVLRPLSHLVLVDDLKEHATVTLSTHDEEHGELPTFQRCERGLSHCEGFLLSLDNKSP